MRRHAKKEEVKRCERAKVIAKRECKPRRRKPNDDGAKKKRKLNSWGGVWRRFGENDVDWRVYKWHAREDAEKARVCGRYMRAG